MFIKCREFERSREDVLIYNGKMGREEMFVAVSEWRTLDLHVNCQLVSNAMFCAHRTYFHKSLIRILYYRSTT